MIFHFSHAFFSLPILDSIRSVRLHIRKKFQIAVFSAEDVIVFQNVIFVYEIMIRRALVLQLIIIPVIPRKRLFGLARSPFRD